MAKLTAPLYNGSKCFCGAAPASIEREADVLDVTSWASPYRQYASIGDTMRVTCERGHVIEGYRPARHDAPDTATEPRGPLPLGPAIPEVVTETEYRRAFGEDDDEYDDYD